jgi:putative hydrolase of the HAD superfamily
VSDNNIIGLLIDLDDTLYDELGYVRSGLAAVAEAIAGRIGRDGKAVRAELLDLLASTGREQILDRALPRFGLVPAGPLIAELVEVYRAHPPRLAFYPGVAEMLRRLRPRYRLAVVTDGLARMQRAKVGALGLDALVDSVIFTWELGRPKPAPDGYLSAALALDTAPARCLVVGDNPDHDMGAAAAAGIPAVRVRSGRFAHRANPGSVRADLAHVRELEAWLATASEN